MSLSKERQELPGPETQARPACHLRMREGGRNPGDSALLGASAPGMGLFFEQGGAYCGAQRGGGRGGDLESTHLS